MARRHRAGPASLMSGRSSGDLALGLGGEVCSSSSYGDVDECADAHLKSIQTILEGNYKPSDGQWRPIDPHRRRTSKERKRAIRKDRRRRRRILERAQCDPTLTHASVRVLGVLLQHSDDTGKRVWPKMATIALNADIAVRSARRCVAELEVAGYVLRFMRPVDSRRNLSNLYYFRVPQGPIPQHRPGQRRRPRRARSPRRTLETGGTSKVLEPSYRAGAAKPAPPQRKPGWRRDMPSNPTPTAQLSPISSLALRAQPPEDPTVVQTSIREARAKLQRLRETDPIGPYGPKRRPASGGPGF